MQSRIIGMVMAALSLVMLLSLSGSWGQPTALAQEPQVGQANASSGTTEEIVEMRARHRKVFRYTETPRLVNGQEPTRRWACPSWAASRWSSRRARTASA